MSALVSSHIREIYSGLLSQHAFGRNLLLVTNLMAVMRALIESDTVRE